MSAGPRSSDAAAVMPAAVVYTAAGVSQRAQDDDRSPFLASMRMANIDLGQAMGNIESFFLTSTSVRVPGRSAEPEASDEEPDDGDDDDGDRQDGADETDKHRQLHKAAEDGNLDLVKTILDEASVRKSQDNTPMDQVYAKDPLPGGRDSEWTALHYAASGGHAPIIEVLLGHGADVDKKNADGQTALHLAARGAGAAQDKMALRLLIETYDASGDDNQVKNIVKDESRMLILNGAYVRSLDKLKLPPVAHAIENFQWSNLDAILKEDDIKISLEFSFPVCQSATKMATTQDVDLGAVVDYFAYGKPLVSMLLVKIFKDAAATDSTHASILLERKQDAEDLTIQLLDALEAKWSVLLDPPVTGSKKLGRAAKKHRRSAIDNCIQTLDYEVSLVGLKDRTSFLELAVELDQQQVMAHPFVRRYINKLWNPSDSSFWSNLNLFSVFMPRRLVDSHGVSNQYAKEVVCYLIFLALYAAAMIVGLEAGRSTDAILWCLLIHDVAMLIYEMQQIMNFKWHEYFSDVFNLLDFLLYIISFFIAILLRGLWISFFFDILDGYAVLVLSILCLLRKGTALAILSILFAPACLRFLEFASIQEDLGPILIVLGKMFKNVGSIAIIIALVLASFCVSMVGWSSAIGSELDPKDLSFLETAEILYLAVIGETDYEAFATRVPYIGKYALSVFQIFTVVIMLNVLTGLFSFSFTSVFEKSRLTNAFGVSKLILRYHREISDEDLQVAPPLNLLYFCCITRCFYYPVAFFVGCAWAIFFVPFAILGGIFACFGNCMGSCTAGELYTRKAFVLPSYRGHKNEASMWTKAIEDWRKDRKTDFSLGTFKYTYDDSAEADTSKKTLACFQPDEIVASKLPSRITSENLPKNVEKLQRDVARIQDRLKSMQIASFDLQGKMGVQLAAIAAAVGVKEEPALHAARARAEAGLMAAFARRFK